MSKESFIQSIHDKIKVSLTFYSKEDGRSLTRLCAPMDFGPSGRGSDTSDKFHFWDYESDVKPHPLSLPPSQIISIVPTDNSFDPSEFVTWQPNWLVSRDWGRFS
ncbi:MAG: hypothetical protein V7752_16360 [Halopseudomonas sp.]